MSIENDPEMKQKTELQLYKDIRTAFKTMIHIFKKVEEEKQSKKDGEKYMSMLK